MTKQNTHCITRIVAVLVTAISVIAACLFLSGCATDDTFDLESHRGGRDARPENTLYSYLYAIETGATTIEADMVLTADGHIVMYHNVVLNPVMTKDASGHYLSESPNLDIRTMTLDEVKSYNVATIKEGTEYFNAHGLTQACPEYAEIPTLEEVFQLVKDTGSSIKLNLETKMTPDPEDSRYKNNSDAQIFVETFNSIVKEYGMEDRVFLQSFDWSTLVIMQEVNPKIKTVALVQEEPDWGRMDTCLRIGEDGASPYLAGLDIDDFNGNYVAAAHSLGFDIVSPYYAELDEDLVKEAHTYGMKVVVWTINDEENLNKMLDMNVDGVITDRMWIIRPLLEARSIKLSQPMDCSSNAYHLSIDHINTTNKADSANASAL